MERFEIIQGKKRVVIDRHGVLYIRVAIELKLDTWLKVTEKAQFFSHNFTDVIRQLADSFVSNFGIADKSVRDPGSLFDNRMSRHIKVAADRALEEVTQCPGITNTN